MCHGMLQGLNVNPKDFPTRPLSRHGSLSSLGASSEDTTGGQSRGGVIVHGLQQPQQGTQPPLPLRRAESPSPNMFRGPSYRDASPSRGGSPGRGGAPTHRVRSASRDFGQVLPGGGSPGEGTSDGPQHRRSGSVSGEFYVSSVGPRSARQHSRGASMTKFERIMSQTNMDGVAAVGAASPAARAPSPAGMRAPSPSGGRPPPALRVEHSPGHRRQVSYDISMYRAGGDASGSVPESRHDRSLSAMTPSPAGASSDADACDANTIYAPPNTPQHLPRKRLTPPNGAHASSSDNIRNANTSGEPRNEDGDGSLSVVAGNPVATSMDPDDDSLG